MPTQSRPPTSAHPIRNENDLASRFELLRPYLLAVARREFPPFLNAGVSASDLVQETYLAAHHQWRQFRGATPEALLPWLKRILRCKVAHERRKRREAQALATEPFRSDDAVLSDAPDRASAVEAPDLQAEKQEDYLRILRYVRDLPDLQRLIIEGRMERDETFVEIGQQLGMTADAVRMSFSRAIELLRGLFEGVITLCLKDKQAKSRGVITLCLKDKQAKSRNASVDYSS